MAPSAHWLLASSALLSLSLAATGSGSDLPSLQSLTAVIRDSAFHELARHRTGFVYQVPLPPHLAGVRASAVRTRSGNLWSHGARVGPVGIPPMATTVPFVSRLAVVLHDLGGLSSSYFDVPGYSLVAPVVGLLAYDASSNDTRDGVREVCLAVLGRMMISIMFSEARLPAAADADVKCARLGPDGSVQLFGTSSGNACSVEGTGHFTVVVSTAGLPPQSATLLPPVPPAEATAERKEKRRVKCVIASAVTVVGLVLLGVSGVGIFTVARRNRRAALAMKAEEDEDLSTVWAGRSKMPSAAVSRTGPTIEDDFAP